MNCFKERSITIGRQLIWSYIVTFIMLPLLPQLTQNNIVALNTVTGTTILSDPVTELCRGIEEDFASI